MSNTGNNNMSSTREADLPPLPPTNVSGPAVCANIRLYLAVWDDLSPVQKQAVSQHLQSCPECNRELQLMKRSTHLIACLETSEPSARVDEAVMAAIAGRSHSLQNAKPTSLSARRQSSSRSRGGSGGMPRMVALGGIAAAVLLVAFLSTAYFKLGIGQPHQMAGVGQRQEVFALPANLSWNGYVLFYKQTTTSPQGNQYTVTSYHNMSDDSMHTETVMDGKVDVLVVKDQQKSLGLDLMHHVAQWDVQSWNVDDSMFDLATLRKDLQSGRATYLGKSTFQGQPVYRVRIASGDILLLNMQYMPVNALTKGQETPGSKPMFDQLQWLQPGRVSNAIWDMKVPANFTMGTIPTQV